MAHLGQFLLVGSQQEHLQGLSHLCKNTTSKLFVVHVIKFSVTQSGEVTGAQ